MGCLLRQPGQGAPEHPPTHPPRSTPRPPQNTACTSPIHTRSSPGSPTLEAPAEPYKLALPKTQLPPGGWPEDQTPDPRWAAQSTHGSPKGAGRLGQSLLPARCLPSTTTALTGFHNCSLLQKPIKIRGRRGRGEAVMTGEGSQPRLVAGRPELAEGARAPAPSLRQ